VLGKVPGDHHFDRDYQGLANLILNELKGAGTTDR
jgi:type IV secretory pathway VirJ component